MAQEKRSPSPLVSVVIPTKERFSLVRRAVDSVRAQTIKNIEIVIVDDSSKQTRDALRRTFNEDSRVTIVDGRADGDAGARRLGVDMAQGTFVAFLDSDDEWKPWALETHLHVWQSRPDLGFSWSADVVSLGENHLARPRGNFASRRVQIITSRELTESLLRRNLVDISCAITTRKKLTEVGGFPQTQPCDWRLWLLLSQTGECASLSKVTAIHHEEATARAGFSRSVRVRDALGGMRLGIEMLRDQEEMRRPGLVLRWTIERTLDFAVAVVPPSLLTVLKRSLNYFVDWDPELHGYDVFEGENGS